MDAVQVEENLGGYGARAVSEVDDMLPWLAQAARELREERGRAIIHVAASLNASESTVWRFEHGKGWPERPDAMIAAYADDLDITPLDIWMRALELWGSARVDAA